MAPSLVDSTLGAWEVGVMIMMFLYGVLASQTWTYYNSGSAGDRFLVRIIVPLVIATESLHSIMICVAIYQHTITSFGDITQIDVPTWTANSTFPIASLTIGIVQAFFAWRIYCISHRWIVTLVAWLGSLVRLGSSLAVAVVSTEMVEASKFIEKYKWLPILCLGVGAMTDILITLALCWFLWKSQPRFRRSKKIVDTLILWTVETGMITSICTSVEVILCITLPNTLYYLAIISFGTKIYSNALLASLNGRSALRSQDKNTSTQAAVTPIGFYRTDPDIDRRIEVQISTQTLEISSYRDSEGDLRNGKEAVV